MIFEVCVDVDRPHRASRVRADGVGAEPADAFTPAPQDETVRAQEKATTDQHLPALVVRLKRHQRLRSFPR